MTTENKSALRAAFIGAIVFAGTMSLIDYLDTKTFNGLKCGVQFILFGATTFLLKRNSNTKKPNEPS